MYQGIENAKRAIRRDLAAQLDWFLPPGDKHFDPAIAVTGVATVFITAFVKGFVAEATKPVEGPARVVFKKLKDWVLWALTGKDTARVQETEAEVQRCRDIEQKLPAGQRAVLIHRTETELKETLLQFMPEDRAVVLARTVRTSVETYLLPPATEQS